MITKENLVPFIQFLYLKKNGTQAPEALISRWNTISEQEMHLQLDHLYDSWNYNLVQRGAVVQEFMQHINTEATKQHAAFSASSSSTFAEPKIETSSSAYNNLQQAVAPNEVPSSQKTKTAVRVLSKLLLAIVLLLSSFVAYKYFQFTHLHDVYTLTERVAIRTESGEQIGTLDLNATGLPNSFQSVTALDNEIYNRAIDSTGKLFEHRKIVLQKNSFVDFVLNKPEIFAYVNAKYVVDSKEEYEMYKRIFGQLNVDDNKRLQLKHRQIIANCLKKSNELKNLYVISSCSNAVKTPRKNVAGILTHELIADNKYEILLRLSDGFYYLCTGDVVSNSFELPRRFGYVTNPNRADEFLNGEIFFRYNSKTQQFLLANCNGTALPYHSVADASGAILFFEKDLPTETPLQPIEEFTEEAQDAIEKVKDVVDEIFN